MRDYMKIIEEAARKARTGLSEAQVQQIQIRLADAFDALEEARTDESKGMAAVAEALRAAAKTIGLDKAITILESAKDDEENDEDRGCCDEDEDEDEALEERLLPLDKTKVCQELKHLVDKDTVARRYNIGVEQVDKIADWCRRNGHLKF